MLLQPSSQAPQGCWAADGSCLPDDDTAGAIHVFNLVTGQCVKRLEQPPGSSPHAAKRSGLTDVVAVSWDQHSIYTGTCQGVAYRFA
jgi:hypothetical protein